MSNSEAKKAVNKVIDKADRALELTAEAIVARAKKLSPVGIYKATSTKLSDTLIPQARMGGRLRGSISWSNTSSINAYEKEGTDSTIDDAVNESRPGVIKIGTSVEYAPYVEYGTSRQASQPFLRPAAKDAQRILSQIIKQMK